MCWCLKGVANLPLGGGISAAMNAAGATVALFGHYLKMLLGLIVLSQISRSQQRLPQRPDNDRRVGEFQRQFLPVLTGVR